MHVLAMRRMRPYPWEIRIPEETSWRHVLGASNRLEGRRNMTVTREKYQLAFGKRMEYVMKQSGMKYEAVADRADLSINVLHRWTHGSAIPSVFTFAKLCLAMNLDNDTVCGLLGLGKR